MKKKLGSFSVRKVGNSTALTVPSKARVNDLN